MATKSTGKAIFIRDMDFGMADLLKASASARGLTLAQYIKRLQELHVLVRYHADTGNGHCMGMLIKTGLQTVKV